MIYTNVDEYGGNFDHEVKSQLKNSNNVTIASGYLSLDIIEKYEQDFNAIAGRGGTARLLVGMAFYEGLSRKKLDKLTEMSSRLSSLSSNSGVYVPYERKYHGKIYIFENNNSKKHFLGSSNFSSSGLKFNMEATIPVNDSRVQNSIDNYIDHLFNESVSKTIEKLEIIVPGSKKFKQRVSYDSLSDLQKYDPSSINTNKLSYFDYDLNRIANSGKSSLNVYFAKGRLNKSTGKIAPRPWYEGELIANVDIIRDPSYPKGDFTAYTDDGYVIPMATNGANNKNIHSKGSLIPFGMWIKSRLQKAGALIPMTPVSMDTFEAYGRSNLRFYKITDDKYFIDFSSNQESSYEVPSPTVENLE